MDKLHKERCRALGFVGIRASSGYRVLRFSRGSEVFWQ